MGRGGAGGRGGDLALDLHQAVDHEAVEEMALGAEEPAQVLAACRAVLHLPRITGEPAPGGARLADGGASGGSSEAADAVPEAGRVGEGVLVGAADFDARGGRRDRLETAGAGEDASVPFILLRRG